MLKGEPAHPRLAEVVLALCGEALALAGLAADADRRPCRGGGGPRLGCRGRAVRAHGARAGRAGGPARAATRPICRGHRWCGPVRAGRGGPGAGGRRPRAGPGRGRARRRAAACRPCRGPRRRPDARCAAIGDEVGPEQPLALVHGRDETALAAAAKRLRDAYIIAGATIRPPPRDPRADRLSARRLRVVAAAAIVPSKAMHEKRNREHERREALRLKGVDGMPPRRCCAWSGCEPGGDLPGAQGPRAAARVPVVLPRPHPRVQQGLGLLPGHEPGRHRAPSARRRHLAPADLALRHGLRFRRELARRVRPVRRRRRRPAPPPRAAAARPRPTR